MKKIGIDIRLYSQTGVGTYIRNLIHYLIRENTEGVTFYLYVLPQDAGKLPKLPYNFIVRESPCLWHSFQEQILLLLIILKDNLDLMHFTYFGFPILYWRPFISTIHDITPLSHKTGKASTKSRFIYEIKVFIFKIVLHYQVRNSKAIITPSFTVKKSLIKLYGKIYEKKITPIYEGVDYQLTHADENRLLIRDFASPFMIYIGNFYPHKNIQRLIKAFSKIKSNIKLILIGPKDYFTNQIKKEIEKLHLEEKVTFFHNVSVSDLKFYYLNAKALIHPSFSEGFGLPIIEAKFFHCPVIISDIEIFHELTGNNAIFFNPQDELDMVKKINLFNQKDSGDYSNTIDSRMSFELMTQRTLLLYTHCLKKQ